MNSITDAWSVAINALRDLWEDLWSAAVCNLIWLVCQVSVFAGPPATLALFYYTNRLAHGEVADLRDFLEGLRRYWKPAWKWGIIHFALVTLLVGDYLLTGKISQSNFARWAQGFYLCLLVFWLLFQVYVLSFLVEQEHPSLRLAFQNAAVLVRSNLAYCLALGSILAVIMAIGTLLFMVSIAVGGVFIGILGNRAVIDRIERTQQTLHTKRL